MIRSYRSLPLPSLPRPLRRFTLPGGPRPLRRYTLLGLIGLLGYPGLGVTTARVGMLGALGPASLAAQTPERAPAVVELPSSSRAMALGHAFQAGPDADAVFYNPALASRARGFALGIHWLTGASRAFTAAAAGEWFGGGIAIGLQGLEYGADHLEGARPGGLDALVADGPTAVSELAATVAYGRDLLGLRVGVAARLLDQRFDTRRRQDVAWDVGVARALGPGTASLAVRHLAPERTVHGVTSNPPTDVTLGWSGYGRPVGPLDLGLAAAVTRRDDGEFVAGGGLEFGYWPVRGRTFVARVGARRVPEGEASPFTVGGSFWGDMLIVDYAFQPLDGTDGIHRLTLGWR